MKTLESKNYGTSTSNERIVYYSTLFKLHSLVDVGVHACRINLL